MKYDYFYVPDLYSIEECSALRQKLYTVTEENIGIIDVPGEKTIKTSEVRFLKAGHLEEIDRVRSAINDVNRNVFGFNCFNYSDNDVLYFNIYDSQYQSQYSWHNDGVKDQNFDIKLTALLNLSTESYEGGEFSLFLNGEYPVPEFKNVGSMIIFPSWVQHCVTPVSKGVRYSMTYFVSGPCFV